MKAIIQRLTRHIYIAVATFAALAAGGAWAEADYINANFYYMNSGNAYTAVTMNNDQSDSNNSDSEGWSSYAVQGKYWNDVNIGSSAAQSVKTYDSSAESTSESSVTVTISGSRGGYFSASGFDHHILSGYIDDNENNTSPLVTFANIPFDYYKVVVYFAADSSSTRFGYITLNDTVNLYGDGTGTDIGIDADGWGGCAPHVSKQNNFQPGQNILVSPVLKNTTSLTLKVQSRSYWPDAATYRSGIAAIQVVKAEAPAACTYTVSDGGTYDLFGDGATSYWSASEPLTGSEAVTISISGDTTLTVNDSRVFASLTVTGSGTLTLAGTGEIVTPSVTVNSGVTLLKTTGQLSTSAAVSVPASSALEIANSCTWSGVISGAGSVKVSANPVTFSAANTYTGGLVVASGGFAQSTNSTGWGSKTVMAVTVQSGGTLDISGEYSTGYNFFIAGTGVDSQGALVNSTAIAYGGYLPGNLTLSADATIDCFNAFGVAGTKSLNLNGHILTIKATSAETAKQFYVHGSYMNGGTTADTGKIVLQSNVQLYSNNGNGISSGQQAILLEAQSGSSVSVGASSGNFPVSNTTIADGAALTVDGTLNLQNGKTLTVNGTANISGTANIGQSGNAGSHLVVGGTVNVNGSGTIKLVSTSNITKNGSGVINIAANAQVWWINCHWTSAVGGDIFRGAGTLYLDSSNGNWSHSADTDFAGKIKWKIPSDRWGGITGSTQFANRAAFNLSDSGQLEFGENYGSRALTVRDFEGGGTITVLSSHSATGEFKVDTLQSQNTTFSGVFAQRANNRNTGLTVRGEEGDVKSLTLSGASTTTGSATVQDNAKLIFGSTGSWANGSVVVADGGILQVEYASSVASTLDLQSGGTITIKTVTTTTTTGEGDEAVEETTTSVVPIAAGTVTFPDSGEAAIDISAIPDLGEDETATIITASTFLDSDISKLRLVGKKPYSLQVSGNNLNVVNDGGLVWDETNGWGTKDATKYDTAIITSPGTVALDGTSLVFDTVGLTGSGTVSFSATGSETVSIKYLVIGDGVTLDVSSALDLTGCTIAGAGTINIPAGVTYTMSNVACSVKVTVQNTGTLKTSGSTNLSSDENNFVAGSQFTVEGDSSSTRLNGAEKGLSGTITVASGATLVNSRASDSINYEGTTVLNVYGTIDMGATRWSLSDGNTINIYEGAVITGNGQATSETSNAGAWDWIENKTCSVNVYGDATISARLRVRSDATVAVAIASGKTLTFSGSYQNHDSSNGSISVSGGVIKLGALNPFVNGNDYSCSLTINDGAAIDINGNKPTNQIYLVGDGPDEAGALINTGADMSSDIAMKITLTGDASWGGSHYTHFGASTDIYLDGHTFTKKGSNNFPLNNTVMRGTGKIVVEEGQFQNNNNNNRLDGIDLEVKTGATLNMAGGTSLRIHDFTCAGTISGTGAKLVVNGTCNVNGAQTIPKLEMVTNSAIAFATTSSKLTANTLTFSLPENGKVLLNVAGLDIPSEGMELINCNRTDNFSVSDGYYLDVVNGSVYAYPRVVNVTVPPIANTTVTVTANGESVEGVNGVYTVPYGSAVVVTYAAANGYELSGTATYNIASATADETIDTSGTTVEKYKGVRIIAR